MRQIAFACFDCFRQLYNAINFLSIIIYLFTYKNLPKKINFTFFFVVEHEKINFTTLFPIK